MKKKEKKVKEYLDLEISRLKLDDFVAQVLIPTEKVFQIRNGKKISKEKAEELVYKYKYLVLTRKESLKIYIGMILTQKH